MQWALVNTNNIVQNIIEYDGLKPYTPPIGFTLRQINDWVKMGMNADIRQEDLPRNPPPDPVVVKSNRNKMLKNELGLVASFYLAKESNPALTFSDFLDDLEKKRDQIQIP